MTASGRFCLPRPFRIPVPFPHRVSRSVPTRLSRENVLARLVSTTADLADSSGPTSDSPSSKHSHHDVRLDSSPRDHRRARSTLARAARLRRRGRQSRRDEPALVDSREARRPGAAARQRPRRRWLQCGARRHARRARVADDATSVTYDIPVGGRSHGPHRPASRRSAARPGRQHHAYGEGRRHRYGRGRDGVPWRVRLRRRSIDSTRYDIAVPHRRRAHDPAHERAWTSSSSTAWSPDGTRLLYTQYENGHFHLHTVRADGTDPKSHDVRHGPRVRTAVVARWNTHRLSSRPGAAAYIAIADADGANAHPLLVARLPSTEFDVAWSTDGSRLYFACDHFGRMYDLCTAALDGSDLRAITIRGARLRLTPCTPICAADRGTRSRPRRAGAKISFEMLSDARVASARVGGDPRRHERGSALAAARSRSAGNGRRRATACCSTSLTAQIDMRWRRSRRTAASYRQITGFDAYHRVRRLVARWEDHRVHRRQGGADRGDERRMARAVVLHHSRDDPPVLRRSGTRRRAPSDR